MYWIAPLLFSGIVACQEEHDPVNPVPPPSTNSPAVTDISPSGGGPGAPNVPNESSAATGIPRNITGEVVSIEGTTYVIKDSESREIRVEANSMTLVDEGIEEGDKAEIRYSADEKPITIRKVRGT
jgi:hypothetical protein